MGNAPSIIAGLCYTRSRDGIFYPEDAEVTRSYFARRERYHIVVADTPEQNTIVTAWSKDIAKVPRSPFERTPQVRSVLWQEYVWMIVSLSLTEADYLNVIALDHGHALATRIYRLPDVRGISEPFPYTGANFRVMLEQKYWEHQ